MKSTTITIFQGWSGLCFRYFWIWRMVFCTTKSAVNDVKVFFWNPVDGFGLRLTLIQQPVVNDVNSAFKAPLPSPPLFLIWKRAAPLSSPRPVSGLQTGLRLPGQVLEKCPPQIGTFWLLLSVATLIRTELRISFLFSFLMMGGRYWYTMQTPYQRTTVASACWGFHLSHLSPFPCLFR